MEKPLNVFISYSWDSEEHKEWVLKLANYLIEKGGCDVILDQYDLTAGGNMTYFMEKSVEEADKVLLILTPNYKLKADNRQGGVGMEYSMISQGLYNMQTNNKKFLPILKEGNIQESAPTYIQTTIYHDMSKDILFDKYGFELLRIIHQKPKLVKPKPGVIPDFSESIKTPKTKTISDGFVESAGKVLRAQKLAKELENLYESEEGVKIVVESAKRIFTSIKSKAFLYGVQMKFPIHSEVYNNFNSLRLQAGDFFAIADYVGYTNNSVHLISITINSGIDENFTPNTNSPIMQFLSSLTTTKNGAKKYFPVFNNDKTVAWESNNIKFLEEDIVSKVFSLLIKEMSNENKSN